ncbi:MAG: sugar phosphate nucleotidyltransferase, partial [candidate division Zixibacteria bacterium]|nr:sugar phosphate nucleotidyltransferase [candidate division Zixibacteria bacterium]
VIIPVAGVGQRLKPHTDSRPKPLLEVGGRTILDHVLKPLDGLSVDEVIFVIGHLGGQIRSYVTENYSFKASFVEQDRLLGLGYAVNMGLEQAAPGPVLIVLGDTIVDCDLAAFVAAGEFVLGVHEVTDPQRFGIVEMSGGLVKAVEEKPEKPKTNLALIGLYYCSNSDVLKEELKRLVQSGHTTFGEIQLTDALASMISRGVRFATHSVPNWYDCGKKETLLATNRFILEKLDQPERPAKFTVHPPVFVDPSATVENSTVGPSVSIGAGAKVVGCTVSNATIGAGAVLENAVIKDSLVGPKAIVRNFEGVLNIGENSEIRGG